MSQNVQEFAGIIMVTCQRSHIYSVVLWSPVTEPREVRGYCDGLPQTYSVGYGGITKCTDDCGYYCCGDLSQRSHKFGGIVVVICHRTFKTLGYCVHLSQQYLKKFGGIVVSSHRVSQKLSRVLTRCGSTLTLQNIPPVESFATLCCVRTLP